MSFEEYVYFNGTTLCKKVDQSSNDFQAIYEDTTQNPIIENSENYKFAIERYSMIGHRLPIWTPFIKTAPNVTTYSMIMSMYTNNKTYTSSETFLNYIPRNNLSSTDPEYLYVYSYEQFIEMMNTAFNACLTSLQDAIIGYTIRTKAPFMVYDASSNLFTIYFDKVGLGNVPDGNGTTELITCTFNNDLYNLINSFYYQRQNNNYWDLIVVDKITNRYTDTTNNVNYIVCSQSYSTTALWSPIQSIIFSSDSIQLSPEYIGSTSVIGSGDSLASNQSNNKQQMITDIILDLDRSSDFNSMITYTPTKLRYISMLDALNIRNVKFSVWWLNKFDQNRYPIKLSNGGLLTIKLLFERKDA